MGNTSIVYYPYLVYSIVGLYYFFYWLVASIFLFFFFFLPPKLFILFLRQYRGIFPPVQKQTGHRSVLAGQFNFLKNMGCPGKYVMSGNPTIHAHVKQQQAWIDFGWVTWVCWHYCSWKIYNRSLKLVMVQY